MKSSQFTELSSHFKTFSASRIRQFSQVPIHSVSFTYMYSPTYKQDMFRKPGCKYKTGNEVEYTLSSRLRGIQISSLSVVK